MSVAVTDSGIVADSVTVTDTVADSMTDAATDAVTVTDADAPVVVGVVGGGHGVAGWVRVVSHTRPAAEIFKHPRWLLSVGDGWRALAVTDTRRREQKLFAKFDGVDDRDAADALTGSEIAVAELPALPVGEYYWSELTGLRVVNGDGVELGVVDGLIETGANDVLVVRNGDADGDNGGDAADNGDDAADNGDDAADNGADNGEQLLPWSPTVILAVDTAAGVIRVDWDADS